MSHLHYSPQMRFAMSAAVPALGSPERDQPGRCGFAVWDESKHNFLPGPLEHCTDSRAEQSIPAPAGMAVADTINEKYSSFCHRIALRDVTLSFSQPCGLKTENEMELLRVGSRKWKQE